MNAAGVRRMLLTISMVIPLISRADDPAHVQPQGDVWDHTFPAMAYLHRTTSTPWDIHLLIIDLKNPAISVETLIKSTGLWGRETVSQMASRSGAAAAINGDFCSTNSASIVYGVPQGLTVRNNEILVAPKFRTAIGFSTNKSVRVGMWTDRWNWYARMRDAQGNEHDVVMMNIDVNQDWLCLYSDKYGRATPGSAVSSSVVEVLVGPDSTVTQIRQNQPGIQIPPASYVLTGREQAANWLLANVQLGERITLDLTTVPDWKNLHHAVSGGPRILKDGSYYADPMVPFPGGEDFEASYKNSYYNVRQPRSAAGTTINGDTLVFVVVDGRQASSAGMTLQELATLMQEFGVTDALQFDSGGSATFFFNGTTRNKPSDGTERPIANALSVLGTTRRLNVAPLAGIIGSCGELLPDCPASKLIDGKKSRQSGKWVDTTNHEHWIELDLGQERPVTHFQLFHAAYSGDPDYLNTREFRILTRRDPSAPWREDFHVTNNRFQEKDNLCTYGNPSPVRYVRLEIPSATHLSYENILRQPEFAAYITDTTATGVGPSQEGAPRTFLLFQNYPNPFNPATTVEFRVQPARHFGTKMAGGSSEFVTLRVYDVLGRDVATLVNEMKEPGTYMVRWDANGVAGGVYFYRLTAGNHTETRKMAIVR